MIKLNALGKKKNKQQNTWEEYTSAEIFVELLTPSHPHWKVTVTLTKQFETYFSFHVSSPDINKPTHMHKIKHIRNQVSQTLL